MQRIIHMAAMALALALATPALASEPAAPTPPAAPEPPPAETPPADLRPHVAITTPLGTIVLRLEDQRAPITSANFLRYVTAGRYRGEAFYRTSRAWGAGTGFVQGGVQSDSRKLFPPIAHEPTSATGLTHCPGAVSMARAAPGSATSDFFILLDPIKGFDSDPAATGDTAGFAAFAEVVDGWAVLQAIYAAEIAPTRGDGVMRGQMLAAPVPMTSIRRIPAPAAADPAKPQPGCVAK